MMELLSGSSPTVPQQPQPQQQQQQQPMAAGNNPPSGSNGQMPTNGTSTAAERLLAGIFDSYPSWDMTAARALPPPSMQPANNEITPPQNDYIFNNFFGAMEPTMGDFGGIGMHRPPISRPRKFPSESSSNSSGSVCCSWCEVSASTRCIECNEFMCNTCLHEHRKSPIFSKHAIVALPTAIGTSSSPTSGVSTATLTAASAPPSLPLPLPLPPPPPSLPLPPSPNYVCDLHNEMLRYVCDSCKKLVCQCCTLHEHKEHNYASISSFVDEANDKIQSAIESSRTGTKCIKSSIDKALTFIRMIERNCIELSEIIRKAFRQFIIAIEDRERFLLDFVDKLRQRRLSTLHEQMAGLKSALSGLAETSEMLQKIFENSGRMDHIEIAMKVSNGQRQLEQFAAIYKDLQPKQEMFGFISPDYSIMQDMRSQGAIVQVDEQNMPIVNGGGVLAAVGAEMGAVMPVANANNMPVANVTMPQNIRRPFMRENSFRSIPSPLLPVRGGRACGIQSTGLEWELSVLRTSPNLHFGAPRSTQAIPGSIEHVKARKSNALSLSFATEGHDEGQVSRPWGLCVDKMGHVLISDRRNNRVQIFNPDGTLKFKFGRKGVGNGEFDLPAGISVDIDNRIIVVDKDNHRVQIFNAAGMYLLKFGSYGKEYGQFQYPWDVAVNSRRQIVVTDSRNHRIQQFDSEGRFIRQIVFDNHGQNKGIASPRGVCYTPTGNIIVSDFDNHCLYLIDPDINEIISAKGHEGSGIQEFNRPSGICCDDDGRIIVADSKNQRIIVYSPSLDYLWSIEIRPSINPLMPPTLDEKDRTCDVALMPDGRIVFLIELSPDSKEGTNPYKRFVHVF